MKAIIVCMAVSKEYGIERYTLYNSYMKSKKFCDLLYEMRSHHN